MQQHYDKNTAALWWLGQMGLMIKIGDTLLCIDYFATDDPSRQTPVPIPVDEVHEVDVFLGTHNHIDHIDHDSWRIWSKSNPDAKFVFPRIHMDSVLSDGVKKENAIGLNAGESYTVGDVTIHAIAAAHEFFEMDEETGLYPHLQYIIEGNGILIHHAGDTVRYEGMLGAVKSFGDIDIELLPINGRDAIRYKDNCIGNMTYQEAADFAGEVGTKLVIPGHWDMFAHNSEDPHAFKDYLSVKYQDKIECKIPNLMEKIVYFKN
ncbi:MBL fold metallo-hydrolase [Pseudobutyrivibrio sp.]|uniref:MBL fold metallo-hydrolase n=1 Tax=Pseudobutyrivibrio sp. TaxID=2014367 RepID=UPI001D2FC2FE|nr:MBL fold metallo-hydrolase [Pseudobutyrivibrio sp.]MBE5911213.1 MBL fold metallo-hydrolase [Pseudobutyrivibrio sp.]